MFTECAMIMFLETDSHASMICHGETTRTAVRVTNTNSTKKATVRPLFCASFIHSSRRATESLNVVRPVAHRHNYYAFKPFFKQVDFIVKVFSRQSR